jgi:hypothetical protein
MALSVGRLPSALTLGATKVSRSLAGHWRSNGGVPSYCGGVYPDDLQGPRTADGAEGNYTALFSRR